MVNDKLKIMKRKFDRRGGLQSALKIACPVGADFTSALTTPTGLNVYKNMTQQPGTTPSGSNIYTTSFYKYATTKWSNNNQENHKNKLN